ncbi:MAG: cupin domain-containing protein [Andreesenia angusta]|nr:cupin domain-containing protein [Andreesenia angusta]
MLRAKHFDNILVGEPAKLAENIDFLGDAIDRKVLFHKKEVSMVQFAFSAEKGLVTNSSHGDIFVYVTSGSLEIELDGKDMTVNEGEFIILPEGLPHSVETDENTRAIFLVVRDKDMDCYPEK